MDGEQVDAVGEPGAGRGTPNLTSPVIGFFPTSTALTWRGHVEYMRDWMLQRAAWLDSTAGWGGPTTTPPPTTAPPRRRSTSPGTPR
ncbi:MULTISPECIES: hypothetical protein [unclassified Micromonospora]|uniref:hypothetical protein n=1 Tax=unclassified Micromonospora TaxID=2617518 RepID=UPI003A8C6046